MKETLLEKVVEVVKVAGAAIVTCEVVDWLKDQFDLSGVRGVVTKPQPPVVPEALMAQTDNAAPQPASAPQQPQTPKGNKPKKIKKSKVLKSASQGYKAGLTLAGHALQKHVSRRPDVWGKIIGNTKKINNTAMKHIKDILNGPGDFIKVISKGKYFLEKMLSDGRGLRLNMDETFKGIIDEIR